MPIMDRRSALPPNNMQASDVAQRLTESIIPLERQKQVAAFRVQGVPAILYSRLNQGQRCTCKTKNHTVLQLSPDGKAPEGAINRALTGEGRFGIGDYTSTPDDDFDEFEETSPIETSPNDPLGKWLGDLNKTPFVKTSEPEVLDNGQVSPDLENILGDFDLAAAIGLSDVSCPICFGTNYIGGFAPFRSWRKVVVATDLVTQSTMDLNSWSLNPGVHQLQTALPSGVCLVDCIRTFNGKVLTKSKFYIDGQLLEPNKSVLPFFDGAQHVLKIETSEPLTHVEIQASLSPESVYFEFPKRNKQDMSLLEQTEPFQIIVSPDIPMLQPQDVIGESQSGKFLIVQNVNPWNTGNRQVLGFECQVRVAQPMELWNILPLRRHVRGQPASPNVAPTKAAITSGVSALKGFTF